MRTKKMIDSAVEHLYTTASLKTVYGDPVVLDGKTVIPVAKVGYDFTDAERQTTADAGGAGGVTAKPIGVVEISSEGTKFVPFGQMKKLAMSALMGSGLGLVLGLVLRGRGRGRRGRE